MSSVIDADIIRLDADITRLDADSIRLDADITRLDADSISDVMIAALAGVLMPPARGRPNDAGESGNHDTTGVIDGITLDTATRSLSIADGPRAWGQKAGMGTPWGGEAGMGTPWGGEADRRRAWGRFGAAMALHHLAGESWVVLLDVDNGLQGASPRSD
jgi:hypothetical protein